MQPNMNCYGPTGESQCVEPDTVLRAFWQQRDGQTSKETWVNCFLRREMAHYWEVSVKRAWKP